MGKKLETEEPGKYDQLIYAIQNINSVAKMLGSIKYGPVYMKLEETIELLEQAYEELNEDSINESW